MIHLLPVLLTHTKSVGKAMVPLGCGSEESFDIIQKKTENTVYNYILIILLFKPNTQKNI